MKAVEYCLKTAESSLIMTHLSRNMYRTDCR